MKDEPTPSDGKTPHERFLALGKKVMAAPKSEVAELEKKWHRRRKATKTSRLRSSR